MRHCAATYIPELMAKRSFLHVNNNEQPRFKYKNATKRCFEIVQIKGIANAEVSKETVNRVERQFQLLMPSDFSSLTTEKRATSAKTFNLAQLFSMDLRGGSSQMAKISTNFNTDRICRFNISYLSSK